MSKESNKRGVFVREENSSNGGKYYGLTENTTCANESRHEYCRNQTCLPSVSGVILEKYMDSVNSVRLLIPSIVEL